MSDYRIVEAEGYAELESKVQALIERDAAWQPLGGAFVRDRFWFQTIYRRPFWGRRLGLFVRRVWGKVLDALGYEKGGAGNSSR